MKIINRIIPLLFYLLFIGTPLIMSPYTSELFEFNKMIFIYLVTVSILFLWILKMIVSKKVLFQKTPLDIPILIFLTSQVLSTIFSIDPHTSLFGYYGRFNGGLLSIIAYIVLFYGYVSNIDREKTFKLLKLSAFASFIVVLWGLPGKMGYDTSCFVFTGNVTNNCWTDQFRPAERMFSTLGQPNWLGAYLIIHVFIGLYFLIRSQKKGSLFFWIIYEITILSGILLTRSRSALLSFSLGLSIFFIWYVVQNRRQFRKIIKQLLITGIIFFFVVVLWKTGINSIDSLFQISFSKKNNVVQTPIKDTNVTDSFDIRKIVWEGAWKLGNQYPLFGTGVETFGYAYYFVRPKEHNLTSEWDFLYNKAHNEYLNYFATAGYLGLGSYVIIIAIFIIWFIRNLKQITRANSFASSINEQKQLKYIYPLLLCSYLSILISNFFGFSTSTIQLFLYLIPAMMFVLFANYSSVSQKQNNLRLNKKQYVMIILSLFIFLYSITYFISYYLADILYTRSESSAASEEYQKTVNYLRDALSLRYEHVYQDKLSYALASLSYVAASQKDYEAEKELIRLSTLMNTISLKAAPYNVLYWKTRAKNYYLFYQITTNQKNIEEAINSLKTAEKLLPTDPKIPYSLAIFYSILFDESKQQERIKFEQLSLQEITKAIDLKPNYRDAYFLKAQMFEKYGSKEEARKTLEYLLKYVSPNDPEATKELNIL
jgi:O-antigen ligase/cytochrome c-type biogenesis protein CcmH/NrfG